VQLKGIVSRDWGRLEMVLLERFEVRTFIFNLKFILNSNFFKMTFMVSSKTRFVS
jgi:hypothetical protein